MSISFLSVISYIKVPNQVKPSMHLQHKKQEAMGSNYLLAQDLKLSTENVLLFLLTEHKSFPKLF